MIDKNTVKWKIEQINGSVIVLGYLDKKGFRDSDSTLSSTFGVFTQTSQRTQK